MGHRTIEKQRVLEAMADRGFAGFALVRRQLRRGFGPARAVAAALAGGWNWGASRWRA